MRLSVARTAREITVKSRSVSGNLLTLWLHTLQVLLSENCSDSAGGDVEDLKSVETPVVRMILRERVEVKFGQSTGHS